MIPLYGCAADDNKLYRLDDASLVLDSGEAIEDPHFISAPVRFGDYATLRRISQRVSIAGISSITLTPFADGGEVPSQAFEEELDSATGADPEVEAPMAVAASAVQIRLEVSALGGPVSLGASTLHYVPRRTARGA